MHLEDDRSMLRRIRATSVLAGTWAIAWAILGVGLATWRVFFLRPQLATPLHYWPRFALSGGLAFGALGLAAGALFALALSHTVHSDTVETITPRRAAGWGGLAGVASVIAMPLIGLTAWPVLIVGAVIVAIVGSTSAALTVAVAQRPLSRTPSVHRPLLSGRL
jgi:hypothetical protein